MNQRAKESRLKIVWFKIYFSDTHMADTHTATGPIGLNWTTKVVAIDGCKA